MKSLLKKRFGSIAVEKGLITTEQLLEVLQVQARENVELGRHRLIGQILLEKGYLTESQLDEVLESMSNSMIYTIAVGR
jgi:aspartate ammonia-lyase